MNEPFATRIAVSQQGVCHDPVPIHAIFPSGVVELILEGNAALVNLFRKIWTEGEQGSLLPRERRGVSEKLI